MLRFTSAYVVCAFTVQRLFIVCLAPKNRFKSKKFAWITVLSILLVSLLVNVWVPFLFKIQTNESNQMYCDIRKEYKLEYFNITFVYICLIMFIPILTVFVCNSIIIFRAFTVFKFNKNTVNNQPVSMTVKFIKSKKLNSSCSENENESIIETTVNQMIDHNEKQKNVNKLAKILVWISISFAILNLPYFIAWCLFYYQVAFKKKNDFDYVNSLYGAVQITEIFFILNYSIQFYINCLTSIKFRKQVNEISKYNQ